MGFFVEGGGVEVAIEYFHGCGDFPPNKTNLGGEDILEEVPVRHF